MVDDSASLERVVILGRRMLDFVFLDIVSVVRHSSERDGGSKHDNSEITRGSGRHYYLSLFGDWPLSH